MLAKLFSERLGLTLVVIVSGLGTALITGNTLTAVTIASVVVLMVGVATLAKRNESSPDHGARSRRAGDPFSFRYTWTTERQIGDVGDIVKQLESLGLRSEVGTDSASSVVLRGGSQIQTRLFGGYFVNPKRLPVQVDLEIISSDGNGQRKLGLKIHDTLGVAVRDKGFEDRYARAACDIRRTVEKCIKSTNANATS